MTDLSNARRRSDHPVWPAAATLVLALAAMCGPSVAQTSDYIAAVVNQEVVTNAELQQRITQLRADAARERQQLPPAATLRQQVLDQLINERVLVSSARDSGIKVDEQELERAVGNVAAQNQLTLPQLRERLRREGIDFTRFRESLKDQLLVERSREREVTSRIKISDADIDALVEQRKAQAGATTELNLAQIMIGVAENASPAVVAERRERAVAALARVRAGEDFGAVARDVSDDTNKAQGGEIGLRAADRLPDLFVNAVRTLQPGQVTAEPLRSGAGFHIVKVVERKDPNPFSATQTRARHILLRPSANLTAEAAAARLAQFARDVQSGAKTFEQLARENSEDSGSAVQGGDLGWTYPGQFVPEFEEAMADLPVGGVSEPVATRFGVHLIQVVDRRQVTLDRRQQREQAKNLLREQKFENAYLEWVRDLRGRAYVELREPPQ